jgi:hypothetical protein
VNARRDRLAVLAAAILGLTAALCVRESRADELCWRQPGPTPDSWRIEVSGLEVPSKPLMMPDTYPGCQNEAPCYCADLPQLRRPYEWQVIAINEAGETPAENGPRYAYRSVGCRLDLDADGAVGMSDLSECLSATQSVAGCGPF